MNRANLNYNYGYSLASQKNINNNSMLSNQNYNFSKHHQMTNKQRGESKNKQKQSASSFYVQTQNTNFTNGPNRQFINTETINEFRMSNTLSSAGIINQQTRQVKYPQIQPQFRQKQTVSGLYLQNEHNNKVIDCNLDLQKYLSWLQEAFGQFERTLNPRILKEINQKNRHETLKLHYELQKQKRDSEDKNDCKDIHYVKGKYIEDDNTKDLRQKENRKIQYNKHNKQPITSPTKQQPNQQALFALKQQIFQIDKESSLVGEKLSQQLRLNQELENQLIKEISIHERQDLNESQIRQLNHLEQMQLSIEELELQIKNLQKKNSQIQKSIPNLPFLKQWNLMFDQAKGATKLSLKLRHQIQKKQTLIKQLTNEDPSNTSQARSVKKGSQNGDRPPSSFKKKENKTVNSFNNISDAANIPKPMTPIIRPASEYGCRQSEKPNSVRSSNDVVIRHLSHSNRFSQSKKDGLNSSVQRNNQRKQSYDRKQYSNSQPGDWKDMQIAPNLKNIGLGFISKDVYRQ